MEERISSFPPVINEECTVLILGSVPGAKSLEKQQYYAHPQNAFWKIMFRLLEKDFTENYDEKVQLLIKNKVALWDVIDSCERKGSLDSQIKNEKANEIEKLLADYPNIKVIFCNGGKSFKNLQKILGKEYRIPIFLLPSTSPLHTVAFEKKLQDWTMIKNYL